MIRIGHGYDVHAFATERYCILGGVTIPHNKGLAGHSDADVLVHALCDALLGAVASGDIGLHFPPGDPQYKDISSMILLKRVHELIIDNGWKICNMDITVIAEEPTLAPYISQMRANISNALQCSVNCISIKATTTEKLGYIGRGEGIAAHAVCLVESITSD